jgi:hypothetical protein
MDAPYRQLCIQIIRLFSFRHGGRRYPAGINLKRTKERVRGLSAYNTAND